MLTAEQEKTLLELGFSRKYFNKSLQKRYKGINGNLSIVIAPNGSWTISGYGPYPDDMRKDLAVLRERGGLYEAKSMVFIWYTNGCIK